jgi:putative ABC transport system permease protein
MLYKSVFKAFLKRRFQVTLLSFIMVMSALIFVVMGYAIKAIKEPSEAYFDAYNQEDFNVTMVEQLLVSDVLPVDDADLSGLVSLSDLYHHAEIAFDVLMDHRITRFKDSFGDTELEARLHKDVVFDVGGSQHFIRVLGDTTTINQTFVTEGRKPQTESEIALVESYASANGLSPGDTVSFHERDYVITGFVLFPDYTLGLFGSEFIINNASRTLALLSDEAFKALPETLGVTLGGVFTGDPFTASELQSSDLPFVLTTQLTTNTLRSGAIYDEIAGSEMIGLVLSLVIASIAILIVAIMVSRMLYEQRGAIGILKALGYTRTEIALPYLLFVVIIALPGLILGYILGFVLATPLKELFGGIYLLPSDAVTHRLPVFLQSIGIPLLFLIILGLWVIGRLLREHPVTLMRPPVDTKTAKLSGMPNFFSRLPLLRRIRHAYVWRHKMRFLVFVSAVLTAAYLILIAGSMMNIFDRMFKDYYDSIDVGHIAYCESFVGCETTLEHDKVLDIPYIMLDDQSVTVIGLDPDNRFHPLYENGKDITHLLESDGVIITSKIAMEENIEKGDMVTLSYGETVIRQTVLGIQDEPVSAKVYVNRTRLSNELSSGLSGDLNNVLYTKERPEGTFVTVISIEDLLVQAEDMSDLMVSMSVVMMVGALSIGIVVLILIITLSIEHYSYDIALFKVIGYTDRDIKGIFINSYGLYTGLVFLMSVPVTYLTIRFMVGFMASSYKMIFPMTLTLPLVGVGFVLVMMVYALAVPITYRKITRMGLADAMKIYQGVT